MFNNIVKSSLLTVLICAFVLPVSADMPAYNPPTAINEAYRSFKDIGSVNIAVPTVVEVPLEDEFIERFDFAVLDQSTGTFVPHSFRQEVLINEVPISRIQSTPRSSNPNRMIDKNTSTFDSFQLSESTQDQGRVEISLTYASPVTSSHLAFLLDKNVALPTTVEIRAAVNGQNQIVVATKSVREAKVDFPKTTSDKWTVTFTYAQPLRISELRLNQDNATRSSVRSIRFLAQPNHPYRIYFDPDRPSKPPVGEAGNLAQAQGVLVLPAVPTRSNPDYVIADQDRDGIPDIMDNCVSHENPDQEDLNNNGRGDICDDFDQDGVINIKDNCPNQPNRDQRDVDSDGVGDVCDEQESRITEIFPWLPWVGIGFAVLVLLVLLILTVRSTPLHTEGEQG